MTELEAEKLEAQKRFEALPENLKKEILADKNVQLISSVCQDYSIPEEKVKHVALLAGEVFLGYIKPEEIASELNKYFGVELQKSNFIEIELKQKLFNGLKADLDKIYNPIKIEVPAEETEEAGPAIIKLEPSDQAPSVIPGLLTRPNPPAGGEGGTRNPESLDSRRSLPSSHIGGGNDRMTDEIAAGKALAMTEKESEAPFIIQTKVEAVKAAIPQFPKESPSLNLKVDPSIIQKNPIIKPVSIHLETAQPAAQEKKFQMPVIAGQKIFTQEVSPRPQPEQLINLQGKPIVLPLIERKLTAPEPVKTVHYSNFKTDLTDLGAPKRSEPKKEDFINLNTFTKISGNTVDLRSTKNEN